MNDLKIAIEALTSRKNKLKAEENKIDELITGISSLSNGNDVVLDIDTSMVEQNGAKQEPVVSESQNDLEALKKGFPYDKRFGAKMKYIDNFYKRPFQSSERIELLKKLEGNEIWEKQRLNFPGMMNYLINQGDYVGKKFNKYNDYSVYWRAEWAESIGKEVIIYPEYELRNDECVNVPLDKRATYEPIIPRAMKKQLEAQEKRNTV